MKFCLDLFWIAAALTLADCRLCAGGGEPQVFSVSPGTLLRLKAHLAAGDAELNPAMIELLREADEALKSKPVSVAEKPIPPASGDKHDYYSIGPYWWPDPSKSNGLPYIRKDGHPNPERLKSNYDRPRLNHVASNAETLAWAYYLTSRKGYAEHAAKLLRVFFLDAETRMNPNMNYAQAIPGITDGRGIGMIESRILTRVADAVALLGDSASWTKTDQAGMDDWVMAFLDWALTSKNGEDERAARNNHGTFYDVQVAHLALFAGRTKLARQILETAREKRIAAQLKPDGSQPLELARVDSFGYSCANLRGYFALATLGEHVGVDLWHYRSRDGAGIRKALDFLLPYVEQPDRPWPYEHGRTPERSRLATVLRQAFSVYGDGRYLEALKKSPGYEKQRESLWFCSP